MGPGPNGLPTQGQTFGGFLSGLGGWLGDNASGLASIGSIAGALDNASDIRDLGYGTQQHLENLGNQMNAGSQFQGCLLYTSPSPRDKRQSRMPSSA